MPMPTTSPGATARGSNGSSVSSTIAGVPYSAGVAPASTYSQRGVITAVPNDRSLGLIRWTRTMALSERRGDFLAEPREEARGGERRLLRRLAHRDAGVGGGCPPARAPRALVLVAAGGDR